MTLPHALFLTLFSAEADVKLGGPSEHVLMAREELAAPFVEVRQLLLDPQPLAVKMHQVIGKGSP